MRKQPGSVAVGLSGGIDSSVAAWLLKQQGWRVIGLTMSIWDGAFPIPDAGLTGCLGPGAERDLATAREMAERLGIEHRVIPLAEEYRNTVVSYFRQEYLAGRTPNPCVLCNQRMKFGFLLEQARAQGMEFDKFGTGHYARVRLDETSRRWLLYRGCDDAKDQSYFLARLKQAQLADVVFPLGELHKEEVRAIARQQGWSDLALRQESQDFVACSDYSILFQPGDAQPGDFVTHDGHVLGQHRGIIHYTVGQRKGLGLGGGGTRWYVLEVDPIRNRVVVGPREDAYSPDVIVADINWVGWAEPPEKSAEAYVQIRQRHKAAPATVTTLPDGRLQVRFHEPQLAVTPGQIAVIYQEDAVLAAGVIAKNDPRPSAPNEVEL